MQWVWLLFISRVNNLGFEHWINVYLSLMTITIVTPTLYEKTRKRQGIIG